MTDDRAGMISTKRLLLNSCFVAVMCTVAIVAALAFATTIHAALYPTADPQEVWLDISDPASASAPSGIRNDPKAAPIVSNRLFIPILSIDSQVERIAVNGKGNISSPSGFDRVGWYRYDVGPDSSGMSIIDGHLDNGLGMAGVFKKLDAIAIGSDVYVIGASGEKFHFVVVATTSLPYDSRLDSIVSLQKGASAELALITCTGNWVPESKTYDKRVVVLADLL